MVAVKSLAHFLARFEERDTLLVNGNVGASARIAPGTRRAMLHREGAKTPEFDAFAACKRRHDLLKDRVYDVLDIPLVQVRVVLGNTLNKFGFDHRVVVPGKVQIAISVKIP